MHNVCGGKYLPKTAKAGCPIGLLKSEKQIPLRCYRE